MNKSGKRTSFTKPGAERNRFTPDRILTFNVSEPATLLSFLFESLSDLKKTSVKNYLKNGNIAVNGTPVTQYDTPLSPSDKVQVNLSRPFVIFRNNRVKLVYEDDDILVVDKGYGLLSVGTGKTNEETAYSILRDYLKRKNPENKIFVIHRLDKNTSGLMMFAKNQEAQEAMQHNWNNMVLERKYVAVVEGVPEPKEGQIRNYLKQNSVFGVFSVKEPEEDAKLAVTRYKTLRTNGGYSTLELQLDTGRKNQIRVHMKDLGTPVAGDHKYGGHKSPYTRMALHASSLRFIHPVTRKALSFTSIPPFK